MATEIVAQTKAIKDLKNSVDHMSKVLESLNVTLIEFYKLAKKSEEEIPDV